MHTHTTLVHYTGENRTGGKKGMRMKGLVHVHTETRKAIEGRVYHMLNWNAQNLTP